MRRGDHRHLSRGRCEPSRIRSVESIGIPALGNEIPSPFLVESRTLAGDGPTSSPTGVHLESSCQFRRGEQQPQQTKSAL